MAGAGKRGGGSGEGTEQLLLSGELRSVEEATSEVNLEEKLYAVAVSRMGEIINVNRWFRRGVPFSL